jgi:uncharacterized membrane protein
VTEAIETENRRDWTWITAVVLAIVGLLDSAYLSYIKLTNQTASCSLIGDCEKVNSSRYAVMGGVPIAIFGVIGFSLLLVLLFLDRPSAEAPEAVRFAFFGVTLAGTLFSVYLTYLELFVLKAICPFCALSALAMVGLFVLSLIRLRLWA